MADDVVVDLARAEDEATGLRRPSRRGAGRRASAGSCPSRGRPACDAASFRRRQPLGRHDDERACASGASACRRRSVEVLRGGRAVDDADVLLRGELQEALEPRARVLGPVALVAVREQERQPRASGATSTRPETMNWSIMTWAALTKSPNCASQRTSARRAGHRIAVLEADGGHLGERRVVDLRRSRAPPEVGQTACRRPRSRSRAGRGGGARTCRARCPGRSGGWACPRRRGSRSARPSACAQSIPPASPSVSRRRSSCFTSFG